MKRIKIGLNKAVAYASSSRHDMRMACILFHGSRPLVWCVNHNRTHPKSLSRYGKVHAEMDAVICPVSTNGLDAYVARLTKPGKISMARPCDSCMTMLRLAGIRRVYWTIDEHNYGELKLN